MIDGVNEDMLRALLRDSPFNRHYYSVQISFSRFLMLILDYMKHDPAIVEMEYPSPIERYQALSSAILSQVPPFQRDNDKWSRERQAQYVWNVLNGFRGAPISLYNTKNDGHLNNCLIHDGLQRMTSICAAFTDPSFSFDTKLGVLTMQDVLSLMPGNRIPSTIGIEVKIYTFDSHIEACQHYIAINKGISHSDADIKRAVDWMSAQR
ncbi:hypothetical protein ACTG16_22610 [Aeromonas sp. 23P]|uniref:hypothetical protein n=1 Tax=Aeromonas sp. 23P TaxID=3452716 RepID=UPI003F796456|nr:hypothetical protein [Aeromonas veronii]